jgi:hypothetical protein
VLVTTDEMRRKVENLAAADFSTIEIAAALDISTASLETYLREELVGGRNRCVPTAPSASCRARDGDRTLLIYPRKSLHTGIQACILARFWTS